MCTLEDAINIINTGNLTCDNCIFESSFNPQCEFCIVYDGFNFEDDNCDMREECE
jgi:hypothetical protein